MKTNFQERLTINKCLQDLKDYYDTCGNENDYKDLQVLKNQFDFLNDSKKVNDIEVDFEEIKKEDYSINEIDGSFRFGG